MSTGRTIVRRGRARTLFARTPWGRRRTLSAFLAIVALVAASDAGARQYIHIGTQHVLRSEVLGSDRRIWVHTPPGYAHGHQRYPVLVLLDGDTHFHHASGTAAALATSGLQPPMIVVGILHPDRWWDLTPNILPAEVGAGDETDLRPRAGADAAERAAEELPGAEAFLDFLRGEVLPYVDREFRTAPFRILVGHSRGGLFATWQMLADAATFQAHLVISPVLGWRDRILIESAAGILAKRDDRPGFLYVAVGGDEAKGMRDRAKDLAEEVDDGAQRRFRHAFVEFDDESHGSVVAPAIRDGLRRLFDGYLVSDPGRLVQFGGLAALDGHFADLSRRLGLELGPPERLLDEFAQWWFRQGLQDDALGLYQTIIERFPDSPRAHFSLGEALVALGRIDEAVVELGRASTLARNTGSPAAEAYASRLADISRLLEQR